MSRLRGVKLADRIQVVGCYALDLYCGAADCDRRESLNNLPYPFPDVFTGRNRRECVKAARRAGWVIRGLEAICPHCAKKAKRK